MTQHFSIQVILNGVQGWQATDFWKVSDPIDNNLFLRLRFLLSIFTPKIKISMISLYLCCAEICKSVIIFKKQWKNVKFCTTSTGLCTLAWKSQEKRKKNLSKNVGWTLCYFRKRYNYAETGQNMFFCEASSDMISLAVVYTWREDSLVV